MRHTCCLGVVNHDAYTILRQCCSSYFEIHILFTNRQFCSKFDKFRLNKKIWHQVWREQMGCSKKCSTVHAGLLVPIMAYLATDLYIGKNIKLNFKGWKINLLFVLYKLSWLSVCCYGINRSVNDRKTYKLPNKNYPLIRIYYINIFLEL